MNSATQSSGATSGRLFFSGRCMSTTVCVRVPSPRRNSCACAFERCPRAEPIPSIGTLGPVGQVEEFGRAIAAQLDFRIEARNSRRFRENFRGHANVVFPEVIETLSTARILTMSYVEGKKSRETSHYNGTDCRSYSVLGPLTWKIEAILGVNAWIGRDAKPAPDGK